MMTIHKLTAGDGYAYLTRQVASADERRAGQDLAGYYTATGTPPGRWLGAGIADLGAVSSLRAQSRRASEPVSAPSNRHFRSSPARGSDSSSTCSRREPNSVSVTSLTLDEGSDTKRSRCCG
ncbi:MAG: hypothetical protein QOE61_1082 [Micromonosporaceae bacterium]|nr:hypothetical protein [Micromonosporaceae bacterium]